MSESPFVPHGSYVESQKTSIFAPDREMISTYSTLPIGLQIQMDGKPVNVEGLRVGVYRDLEPNDTREEEDVVILRAKNIDTGVYELVLPTSLTDRPCYLRVRWEYQYEGQSYVREVYYTVVGPMPLYDSFSPGERQAVRNTLSLFGDLFDNQTGGVPSFYEEFPTRFDYNRVAELMLNGLNKINIANQPLTRYGLGGQGKKPFPEKWYGLLQQATYIEILKHFVRTYVEQPTLNGNPNVTYADRRDYMNRWQQVLKDEQDDLKDSIRMFKREELGLGRGAFLVSGGMYGRMNGAVSGYGMAARGARFYPLQSMVMSYGYH